jgi:hypothetical protein
MLTWRGRVALLSAALFAILFLLALTAAEALG